MSRLKEFSRRLRVGWDALKHDPEYTKSRAKVLLKVGQDMLIEVERLERELRAYKQPKLWQAEKEAEITTFQPVPFRERIRAFLIGDLESEEFKRFLRWNNLTLEQAIKIIEEPETSI